MKTGIYRKCPECSYLQYELAWESLSLKVCPNCQCNTTYAKKIKMVNEKNKQKQGLKKYKKVLYFSDS